MQFGGTDHPLNGGTLVSNTDPAASAAALNAITDQIERGVVPAERFYHVHYRDLVRDPLGTVAALYRHFAIPFGEESRAAIARYIADNPRDARPSHKLGISEEALREARAAYHRYQEYFGVQSE